MRKCVRCGAEMKEGCTIKVEGAGYGIVMSNDENKFFEGAFYGCLRLRRTLGSVLVPD